MQLICPVLFGLEKPLVFELRNLGYASTDIKAEDGQVSLRLPEALDEVAYHVARCNIQLRTAERCQLELFSFHAEDFDELFEKTYACPWEEYIPQAAKFSINGYSRKSKLFGVPAMQRLIKKAIVKRLLWAQGLAEDAALPESEEKGDLELRFAIVADHLSLRIETSGMGLHKRGYRPMANEAPIKETLASGLLDIMRWSDRGDEAFVDLFCGSGTLPIEAALKAAGVAPGLNRRFAFEDWSYLPTTGVSRARAEAASVAKTSSAPARPFIFASDIDAESVAIAEANAQRAGVAEWIKFEIRDALSVDVENLHKDLGFDKILLLSNPPYGERMSDVASVRQISEALGQTWLRDGTLAKGVHWGIITADDYFEQACGYRSDKRRKLYNGMIKCYLYQYFRAGKRKMLY